MLDQRLAETMRRVLARDDERFVLSKALEQVLEHGIGSRRGKSAYFTAADKAEIRSWLEAKGFSTDAGVQPGMTRSERLTVTPNEKAGGEAIKRHRIAIKALARQPLLIGTERLFLPPESHLDIDWNAAANQSRHTSILVVENYENFNRIHETQIELPKEIGSPLVLYRGDPNESRIENVQQFLTAARLPVLAFVDADPAGLGIACAFPHLSTLILPPVEQLEAQLRDPRTARKDLFMEQYATYGAMLDALDARHPCSHAWQLISKFAAGVVQERWVRSRVGAASVCAPPQQ